MLGLGPLSKNYKACQGQPLIFEVSRVLRDFRKVYRMKQCRLLVWNSHWKRRELARCVWWGRVSITRAGQMALARLMESSNLVPAYVRLAGWKESTPKE